MLIGTFEVQIHGRLHLIRMRVMHALERQPGVGPHVHDVGDLLVVVRIGAQQLLRIEIEPGFDAVLLDQPGHRLDEFLRARMQLLRFLVHEQRDRHAPGALARQAPVRAVLDHVVDALFAPGRHPLRLLDVTQRVRAQALLLHADEPLRGRAEDQRGLVPPAAGITVLDGFVLEQPSALPQFIDQHLVGVAHLDTGHEGRAFAEAPVTHHRVVHREAVFLADDEVFLAVRGRGVHGARAGFQRDVIAQDHRHVFGQEGMLQLQVFERVAGELHQHLALAEPVALEAGVQ